MWQFWYVLSICYKACEFLAIGATKVRCRRVWRWHLTFGWGPGNGARVLVGHGSEIICDYTSDHLGVEPKIGGKPPKSSILIGFSIINHPFWGFPPIFGSTPISVNSNPTWFWPNLIFSFHFRHGGHFSKRENLQGYSNFWNRGVPEKIGLPGFLFGAESRCVTDASFCL